MATPVELADLLGSLIEFLPELTPLVIWAAPTLAAPVLIPFAAVLVFVLGAAFTGGPVATLVDVERLPSNTDLLLFAM